MKKGFIIIGLKGNSTIIKDGSVIFTKVNSSSPYSERVIFYNGYNHAEFAFNIKTNGVPYNYYGALQNYFRSSLNIKDRLIKNISKFKRNTIYKNTFVDKYLRFSYINYDKNIRFHNESYYYDNFEILNTIEVSSGYLNNLEKG